MTRTYFFLSYAHSAPVAWPTETDGRDADHWVRVFFADLSAAVELRTDSATSMTIGFIDKQLLPGADWNAELSQALGSTEVFVPLYSPSYLNWSWPRREREAFERRLANAKAAAHLTQHVAPVLWLPIPSWGAIADRDPALDLGAKVPAYAENGLRALLMLNAYRDDYEKIVDRLARQIVDVAERHPLGRSAAPSPSELPDPAQATTDTPFVIAVLAPSVVHSAQWRPFSEAQALPIAEYAATVAERLGLPTRVMDFASASGLFSRCPGLVLIDPATRTFDALAELPEWVTLLVVAQPARAVEVTNRLEDLGSDRVTRAAEVDEFVQLMPALIAEARREYLRNAPVFPPKGPHVPMPTLSDPTASASPRPQEDR